MPDGRKRYTKTKPLRLEELEPCLDWWNKRVEKENIWLVPVNQITKNDYSLDIRNPFKEEEKLEPPEVIIKRLIKTELKISSLLFEIEKKVEDGD